MSTSEEEGLEPIPFLEPAPNPVRGVEAPETEGEGVLSLVDVVVGGAGGLVEFESEAEVAAANIAIDAIPPVLAPPPIPALAPIPPEEVPRLPIPPPPLRAPSPLGANPRELIVSSRVSCSVVVLDVSAAAACLGGSIPGIGARSVSSSSSSSSCCSSRGSSC